MNVTSSTRTALAVASGGVTGGAIAGAISSPVLGPSDKPFGRDLVRAMYVGGIGFGVLGLAVPKIGWTLGSLAGVGVGMAYVLAKTGVDQLSR